MVGRHLLTGLLVLEAVATLLIVYGGVRRWGPTIEVSPVTAEPHACCLERRAR